MIKLPESMRDRIEKLPAQTLQQLEEIRIRTVEITTYEKAPAPVTTGTDAPGSTTATTTTTAAE